ncbi:UvrD-helicase domain-containing protein [Winogradskyella aquimaris]|uniref:DNA 3'-5' helicase n=1 Tax=Winogradskyella aquimaris TaxID=864074 RepID=A0ABU5EIV3_9FLAO|nr:UvrD-helicase domain-containing protein [Winogradskyella aquimaris]MDY2586152.1 UvrD-helicase domain-containing protein [Winogradskyella aquimaris]
MQDSSFKIYNASAGSGKTFTLAKTYIKILVGSKSNDQFKSILAITFTNKAVGEMKERIIEMLKLFSQEESLSEPHAMFISICEELSITPEFLMKRSKQILKHIMHNYGAFDISTIDGFTHRVIRTFAHDLKLPVNFEVELDQDRLLNEAVDNLISRAGENETLTQTLVDFAIEKADDDKSWDISYDFNKIAKVLVNENDIDAIESFKDKTIDDFNALKSALIKDIDAIESEIKSTANNVLNLIEECGLQFDDFNRKSLPNHFYNLSQYNFSVSFTSAWQNDLIEGGTLYPKRVKDAIAQTIESIQPNLSEAFLKTKDLIFELRLKQGFCKNITPLSVLSAIQYELNVLKEEQNKMLISEFNKIISNEIKGQPTPFIYERLGEKFKHYFIDEFQDTSQMQWDNLAPLLDNALSASNGSAMLVGDAKQSIYRWRGGEPEQFINLYNKTTNPFQIEAEVLSLDTNYRSAKEIINFNNDFFQFLSQNYFNDSRYAELYLNSNQETFKNLEGFVNIEFLDISKDDDTTELYAQKTFSTIIECIKNGYTFDDICVIVRKSKEGVAIAHFLSERGIKITSSETLLLKNSEKVLFLDSLLRLFIEPENDNLRIEILSFLATYFNIEDKHSFYSTHLNISFEEMLKRFEDLNIYLNKNKLFQLPLYELVEELIRAFNFHNTSDAFLQFYLDVIFEFTQQQNSDLTAFINYFEKKKDTLSVVSPKNDNAIQIMTIHKSKGLEFPIVIFPFAELDIYREVEPKVWFPVEKKDYQNFETLLLNYNSDVANFGMVGEHLYDLHQNQLELDNINLLYVTLTRAVEQLYIISKKDINSKGVVNEKTYAGMFISYLQHKGLWTDDSLNYDFGTYQPNKKEKTPKAEANSINLISVPKENHNLQIITKAGQLWDTKQGEAIERGNLVHLILSKIKTFDDIDFAIDDLLVSGDIAKQDEEILRSTVMEVIQHPKLNYYFQNIHKVYNERDIVTPMGEILRPDRININLKNEAVLIDYKTGEQKTSHKSQLHAYASVLESMNYNVKHKYLVYINDRVEVIEV